MAFPLMPMLILGGGKEPLVAVSAPPSVSISGSTAIMTTGFTFVTVTGATGPAIHYAWERVSGSANIAPNSPTAPGTSFSNTTNLFPEQSVSAVFRCKVTDVASGEITYTNNVSVSISRNPS